MWFPIVYFIIAFIVTFVFGEIEDDLAVGLCVGILWPIVVIVGIIALIIFAINDHKKDKEKEKKVMADAKRCDRCGKYYVQGEKKYKIRDKRITRVIARSFYDNDIVGWDLCDDCVEAFDEFMRMEGEECLKE